jgi:hypothetical protein
VNPLAGCVPSVPTGEKLVAGSPEFNEMEKAGTAELAYCGFVLVAGGLGERLGYNGMCYDASWSCSASSDWVLSGGQASRWRCRST